MTLWTSWRPLTTHSVLPVLCFPDMQPDEQIEKLAHRKRVCLLWQCDQPDQRLQEILLAQPVRSTLPTSRISREAFGVTDGLINLDMMDNAETSDISCLTSPDSSAQLDPAGQRPAHEAGSNPSRHPAWAKPG